MSSTASAAAPAASAFVQRPTKYLRVPAYARAYVPGELEAVEVLPINPQKDNAAIYAVRLRDNFTTIEATFAGERGYIINAMLH